MNKNLTEGNEGNKAMKRRVLHTVDASSGGDLPDFIFFCPGCKCGHGVWVTRGQVRWIFNGDMEKPTFRPSLLIKGSKFTEAGQADYEAWEKAGYPERNGKNFESKPTVCHSFVTDGKIQFLTDCTHELRGQTVPLEDFDKEGVSVA